MPLGFCGACEHFETNFADKGLIGRDGEVKGACHRFPPSVFVLGNGPQGPVMQTQFPMPHSKMWCSEFSPRKKDSN